MNKQSLDVLNLLVHEGYTNQRNLAEKSGHSLGIVNRSLKELYENGYIEKNGVVAQKGILYMQQTRPQNAIILAAGLGMRMIPINSEVPKGLLEIRKEPLIERLIRQLHEVGITDINIVVGFMKEKFEYLIDEFGVNLIVNRDYADKNNLHSMRLASAHLSNTYILPCDLYCRENPFHKAEPYSWYMVGDRMTEESTFRVNNKSELVRVDQEDKGNVDISICYLLKEDSDYVKDKLEQLDENRFYQDAFWEECLYEKDKMVVAAKVVKADTIIEINTFEQLCEVDRGSNHIKTDAIQMIEKALHVTVKDIVNISILKKGLSNHSFLFSVADKKYIMKIPDDKSVHLFDRFQEAQVYSELKQSEMCENIVAFNPENGYMITAFFENARVCDPYKEADVKQCMDTLHKFHKLGLVVDHRFDIFEQINTYETLWDSRESFYKDYRDTKEKVFSLKKNIGMFKEKEVLSHIDPVYDNFLFVREQGQAEKVRLIDWEMAGMCDPHIDIAMYGTFAMYDRAQMDQLIDLYFEKKCREEVRIKIYCLIAACGLFWSNWCEYKMGLGVEFGEYSLKQYRYAKEYYKIAVEEMQKLSGTQAKNEEKQSRAKD